MSWRTVVINSKAKLSYKNDYMIIRGENVNQIHLSEINTVVINSTAVTITSYLIAELLNRKVKIIFCDNRRDPIGEVLPYYGCHNVSKRINEQINWDEENAQAVWTRIIKEKILNQARLLEIEGFKTSEMLKQYADELVTFDKTNREGHSAKVYFDSLFGVKFTRDAQINVNAALNYGYAIILSQFNRDIAAQGYLTQLGIKHKNEFNPFNLSSDLMEPFRQLVDRIVYENAKESFDPDLKLKLIDVLNHKVRIKGSNQYVSNAISIYDKSVFDALKKKDASLIEFFEYEL